MKKLFTLLMLLSFWAGSSWGQVTNVFTEYFDGTWTIPGSLSPSWAGTTTATSQWQKSSYTAGWSYPTGGAYSPVGAVSTSGSARFHAYGISSGVTSDFISPGINLSACIEGTTFLEFYHINASGTDNLKVYVSSDGGSTWSTALITCGTSASWEIHTAIALNTISSNVKIKFTGTSDYGDDDIGLDQVRVYGTTPPCTTPTAQPTSLVFNNIYLLPPNSVILL